MSAALKYISCPVSQLDLLEPIGIQTQVDSFKRYRIFSHLCYSRWGSNDI